jgi:hypothetical protein
MEFTKIADSLRASFPTRDGVEPDEGTATALLKM